MIKQCSTRQFQRATHCRQIPQKWLVGKHYRRIAAISHHALSMLGDEIKICLPSGVHILYRNGPVGDHRILGHIKPFVARIERRPLTRLRNGTLWPLCRGLKHIDFRSGPAHERAVSMRRSGVFLTGTGTTGQPFETVPTSHVS